MAWIVLGVAAFFALIIFFWIVGMFNGLVRFRNQVRNAWSQIDVQLKRRCDLIPNLVETAKGYMKHEAGTLTAVTEARARAMGAGNVGDRVKAEGELTGALSKFLLSVEAYPDLKANTNFLALQEELTSTENKISFARQNYNDQSLFLNNKIEMFPSNIIAGMFRFEKAVFFEVADKAERAVPKVSF